MRTHDPGAYGKSGRRILDRATKAPISTTTKANLRVGTGWLDSLVLMICDASSYTALFIHAHLKGSTSIPSHVGAEPSFGMCDRDLFNASATFSGLPRHCCKGDVGNKQMASFSWHKTGH